MGNGSDKIGGFSSEPINYTPVDGGMCEAGVSSEVDRSDSSVVAEPESKVAVNPDVSNKPESKKVESQYKNNLFSKMAGDVAKAAGDWASGKMKKAQAFFAEAREVVGSTSEKLGEVMHPHIVAAQISKIDESLGKNPDQEELYQQRAELCFELHDYAGASDSLLQLKYLQESKSGESLVKSDYDGFQDILQKQYAAVEQQRDAASGDDALLLQAQLVQLARGLGDKSLIEAENKRYVEFNQKVRLDEVKEKTEELLGRIDNASFIDLNKAGEYVGLVTGADEKTHLSFNASFNSLKYEEQLGVMGTLQKNLVISFHDEQAAKHNDKPEGNYHQGMKAYYSNQEDKVRFYLGQFLMESRGKVPASLRKQAGDILRPMTLAVLDDLEAAGGGMLADQGSRLFTGGVTKAAVERQRQFLVLVREKVESGEAATIDEAVFELAKDHARNRKDFERTGVVVAGGFSRLPKSWNPNSYRGEKVAQGREMREAQDGARNDFVKLYRQDPNHDDLKDPSKLQALPTVQLRGGMVEITSMDPRAVRVIIGKEGGTVVARTGNGTEYMKFDPSNEVRVLLIENGNFISGHLGSRYRYADRGEPERSAKEVTKGGSENLAWLFDEDANGRVHPKSGFIYGWQDATAFMELVNNESLAGLQERAISNDQGKQLERADKLRAAGSYTAAGELYEELLKPVVANTIKGLSEDEVAAYVREHVQGDHDEVKKSIEASLSAQKKTNPERFKEKFGDWPSSEVVGAMVVEAMNTRGRLGAAYQKIGNRYDNINTLGDEILDKAWVAYNGMLDPNGEWFNFQDRSWDAIADELVMTAITMPVTMGVGSAFKVAAGGTNFALKLASGGRASRIALHTGMFVGRNVVEGTAQTAIESSLGLPTNFYWNVGMSMGFHGGGRLAQAGSITIKEGEKIAVRVAKQGINFAKTMGVQTTLATAMGAAREWETFELTAEVVAQHAARMLNGHIGAKVFHKATGNRMAVAEQRVDTAHKMAAQAARATKSEIAGLEAGQAILTGKAINEETAHALVNQAKRDANEAESAQAERANKINKAKEAISEPFVQGAKWLSEAVSSFNDFMGGGLIPAQAMAGGAASVRPPKAKASDQLKGPVIHAMASIWDGFFGGGRKQSTGSKAGSPDDPHKGNRAGTPDSVRAVDAAASTVSNHFSKAPQRTEVSNHEAVPIGREVENGLKLTDAGSSRKHGTLEFDHTLNQWMYADTGANGTHVNGVKVDSQSRARLKNGDLVRFGKNEEFYFFTSPDEQRAFFVRKTSETNLVEVFHRGNKSKYVGFVELVPGRDGELDYRFTDARTGQTVTVDPSKILTIQPRHRSQADADLNRQYVKVNDAQFQQGSYNQSGVDGKGMMVRVDFSDPRLSGFIDQRIKPIQEQLRRGQISKEQAAIKAYEVIRDHVPYDYNRVAPGSRGPANQLYSLGDYVATGVCNERGMLLQVSLQYLGIKSEMQKGRVIGGRHAWVEVTEPGIHGLKLDPQESEPVYLSRSPDLWRMLRDDGTPFEKEAMSTAYLGDEVLGSVLPARARQAAPQPESVMSRLERLNNSRLMTIDEDGRETPYFKSREFRRELESLKAELGKLPANEQARANRLYEELNRLISPISVQDQKPKMAPVAVPAKIPEAARVVPVVSVDQAGGKQASYPRTTPEVSGVDTVYWDSVNQQPKSIHSDGTERFISDAEINKVIADPRSFDRKLADNIPYTIDSEGRHVMQQMSIRGCTAAVTAMLILDNGGTPNTRTIKGTNLGNEQSMLVSLKEAGLRGKEVRGMRMEEAVELYGAVIAEIGGEIGGHVIIVDYYSPKENKAIIRDPWHGWSIETTVDALVRRQASPSVVVESSKVKPAQIKPAEPVKQAPAVISAKIPEAPKVTVPRADRYAGDLRRVGSFAMVNGKSVQLPGQDGVSISLGQSIPDAASFGYIPLGTGKGLREHHAQIRRENGELYIEPTSMEPVFVREIDGSTRRIELGGKEVLHDGVTYILGDKEFTYYSKKSEKELARLDDSVSINRDPSHAVQFALPTVEAIHSDLRRTLASVARNPEGSLTPEAARKIEKAMDELKYLKGISNTGDEAITAAKKMLADSGISYESRTGIASRPNQKPAPQKPDVDVSDAITQPMVLPLLPNDRGLTPNAAGKPRRDSLHLRGDKKNGEIAAATHEGVAYKEQNEDGYVAGTYRDSAGEVLAYGVVLDGMGGHGSGDIAAELGGKAIREVVESGRSIEDGYAEGSGRIENKLGTGRGAPGAVAAGFRVVIKNGKRYAEITHVGDAQVRVLRQNDQGLYDCVFTTKDQNRAQMIEDLNIQQGRSPRDTLEMWIDPSANIVSNALGSNFNKSAVSTTLFELKPGDRIIVVSDGASENTRTKTFEELSNQNTSVVGLQKAIMGHALDRMKIKADMKPKFDEINQIISDARSNLSGDKKAPLTGLDAYGYGDCTVDMWGTVRDGNGKEIKIYAAIDSMPGYWMDAHGVIVDQHLNVVDKIKQDNVTALVYQEP